MLICAETIEREGRRKRRGRDCVSESWRVAAAVVGGESGWESATERGGGGGVVALAGSPAVYWSEAGADV